MPTPSDPIPASPSPSERLQALIDAAQALQAVLEDGHVRGLLSDVIALLRRAFQHLPVEKEPV